MKILQWLLLTFFIAVFAVPVNAQDVDVPIEDDAAKEEEDKEGAASVALREVADKAFVVVRIHPRKDLEKGPDDDEGDYFSSYSVDEMIKEKITLDLPGVLIGGEGRVLIGDLEIKDANILKIEVVDGNGKVYEAEREGILANAPGMFLRLKTDTPPAGGVVFKELGEMKPETVLMAATFSQDEDRWIIEARGLGRATWVRDLTGKRVRFLSSYSHMDGDGRMADPVLVFNKDGEPVGCTLFYELWPQGGPAVWRGEDLLADSIIAHKGLEKKKEDLKKKLAAQLPEVKIRFWQKSGESGVSPGYRRYGMSWLFSGFDSGKNELTLYALAITKNMLLLPQELGKESVTRIESVTVGADKLPAKFAGEFKDLGITLFRITEGELKDFVKLPGRPALTKVKPFLKLRAERKFDALKLTIDYIRCLSRSRGYKDTYSLDASRDISTGDFIMDMDGNFVGFAAREKREGEEAEKAGRANRYYYSSHGSSEFKLYNFADISKELAEPGKFFDNSIVPRTKKEAAKPLWLGVEYYAVNNKLAKHLKCLKPTKDGSIGLILSHVYTGSPAEKLGLKDEDILLTLKKVDSTNPPIELQGDDYESWDIGGRYEYMLDTGDMAHEYRMPILWRGQDNYLNELIKSFKEGTELELEYFTGGAKKKVKFKAEYSPTVYENAEKHKDEDSGLTVKDVTFEVTFALRLGKDFKGVIVSKIESGQAASLARIRMRDIIIQADGQPVGDVKAFEQQLKAAREAGKEKIILALRRLDRTEVVHMGLKKIEKKKDEVKESMELPAGMPAME